MIISVSISQIFFSELIHVEAKFGYKSSCSNVFSTVIIVLLGGCSSISQTLWNWSCIGIKGRWKLQKMSFGTWGVATNCPSQLIGQSKKNPGYFYSLWTLKIVIYPPMTLNRKDHVGASSAICFFSNLNLLLKEHLFLSPIFLWKNFSWRKKL